MTGRNFISRLTFTTMGSFKKVTHVIFDLDGLILDSEGLYRQSIGAVIESFGKCYHKEVRLAVMGTMEIDTARIIVERLKLPVTPEKFSKLAKIEQRKVLGNVELKEGAESLIKHLSKNNIPIAVATSSSEQSYNFKTSKYKSLMSNFHHIVTGSSDPEVVNGKPAPDIFLIAAKRFNDNPPSPEKCLVFEDAPNGVKAARAAGMQVVMVPEEIVPCELKQDATLVINSLCEFKPELFGLPPL